VEWNAVGNAIATGLAVGGGFLGMAWKADELLSDEIKEDIGLWLLCAEPKTAERYARKWPKYISTLFDQIFGEKHLSWKCFRRSCVASLVSFIIFTFIYFQTSAPLDLVEDNGWLITILTIGFLSTILNFLPDYFSLLETRVIIYRLRNSKLVIHQLFWLLVDLILTMIIIAFVFNIFALAIILLTDIDRPTVFELTIGLYELALFGYGGSSNFFGIYIWTTFVTSVWVWLYFLAQLVTRLLEPIRPSIKFLQYALPIEKYPLRSVGAVMGFLACLITSAILIPQVM